MAQQVSREYYEQRVKSARGSLLLAIILTVVNTVLLLAGSETYFLFSVSVPYYLSVFGYMFDGGIIGTLTVTALVIAGVILLVYLLVWLFSKKTPGLLWVAAALFIIDTTVLLLLALLSDALLSSIIDLVIHGFLIFDLIRGALAAGKMKQLPEETAPTYYTGTGAGPEIDL